MTKEDKRMGKIIDGEFKEVKELDFIPVYRGKLYRTPKKRSRRIKRIRLW